MKTPVPNPSVYVIIFIILMSPVNSNSQTTSWQPGSLKVLTGVKGKLLVDGEAVKTMTRFHTVLVSGLAPGPHTISFNSDSIKFQQKVIVQAGLTNTYDIRHDTAILLSSGANEGKYARKMKVKSNYIPRGKGFCALVKVGFSSTTPEGVSPFYGQVIAGYQFSPVFQLGGGVGFVQTFGSFNKTRVHTFIYPETVTYTISSDPFSIPFIPVFIDARICMLKKRVTPYFGGSFGCSFPLTQTITGTATSSRSAGSGSGSWNSEFHIRSIKPGFYFAINPGVKAFIYGKYYIDFLFGWDICVNKVYGELPDDNGSWTKGTSSFHINIGFGF